jgi:ADP-dependent NAD(P)H-hydrate dehydratase
MIQKGLNAYLPDVSAPNSLSVGEGMSSTAVYRLIGSTDVRKILKPRKSFTHKGTYGHVLVVAGQAQTMGAALLCSTACLYAGAGLTTAAIPSAGLYALNTTLPEVMYLDREDLLKSPNLDKYNTIAVGPGLGTDEESINLVIKILSLDRSAVLDADALNILAKHPDLLMLLPQGTILTPHVKEFDHLFGEHKTWFHRIQTAREKAKQLGIVIILKNQYTFIIDDQSHVYINSTGNPAMAQGGMGDILTGIVAACLAEGYHETEAAILACHIHGRSGDELAAQRFVVTASQVAKHLPFVFREMLKP